MHTERANLLACIGYATTQVQPARLIALTAALAAFLLQEGPWHQAAALHDTAATTAHHHGDRRGEAWALRDLGRVRSVTGNYPAATSLLELSPGPAPTTSATAAAKPTPSATWAASAT